jgi:hypothetical protein
MRNDTEHAAQPIRREATHAPPKNGRGMVAERRLQMRRRDQPQQAPHFAVTHSSQQPPLRPPRKAGLRPAPPVPDRPHRLQSRPSRIARLGDSAPGAVQNQQPVRRESPDGRLPPQTTARPSNPETAPSRSCHRVSEGPAGAPRSPCSGRVGIASENQQRGSGWQRSALRVPGLTELWGG